MKQLLTLLLLLVGSISLNAQIVKIDTIKSSSALLKTKNTFKDNSLYLYSVGLRVFKQEQFPKLLAQENSATFRNAFLNGLMFKFNDNQITYRLLGSFYHNDITFINECSDCEIVDGKLTDFTFKVGFQKLITYSAIQPYFGFDVGFRKNRFKGEAQNAGASIAFTQPYDVLSEKNGAIFSPLIGLNFNIINHFTIEAESSLDMLFNYERQEKTFQDANRSQEFKNDKNWEYLLRPIAISLVYNFGQAD